MGTSPLLRPRKGGRGRERPTLDDGSSIKDREGRTGHDPLQGVPVYNRSPSLRLHPTPLVDTHE